MCGIPLQMGHVAKSGLWKENWNSIWNKRSWPG